MVVDRESLKGILSENGYKMTNQRLIVFELLSENEGAHLAAEEMYERIKVDNPHIGLATVYRTVQLFAELGLIDRINLDDGYTRYELNDKGKTAHHRHHHLICLRCGGVTEFEDDMLEALETEVRETLGFRVTDHEVKLYGYCRNCQINDDNDRED